jgi:uncharacterized phage protein (TIGR01671 family)
MREIKFRAWNISKKEMFYYGLSNHGDFLPNINIYGKLTFLGTDYNDECYLMQYTGLKDKNGKEIYEGDILRVEGADNPINKVYWGELGWELDRITLFTAREYRKEVIGNIYENPELLKEI